jgi:hypothetical protein
LLLSTFAVSNDLTVQLVGAAEEELMKGMMWEEIFHRLPALKVLNVRYSLLFPL